MAGYLPPNSVQSGDFAMKPREHRGKIARKNLAVIAEMKKAALQRRIAEAKKRCLSAREWNKVKNQP